MLALFVALSGSAYATTIAPKNSVRSKSIRDGAVHSRDIRNHSVTSRKLHPFVTRTTSFPGSPRTVQCRSGEQAVGGGAFAEGEAGSAVYLSASYPVDRFGGAAYGAAHATGWHVDEDNRGLEQGAAATGATAYVICAS
jgi:hypothetical protein